jgi:hypothetical protein
MTHWLLKPAIKHLQSMDSDRRKAFLIDRLYTKEWVPISAGAPDLTGEEPEDVLAAALSIEGSDENEPVRRDAIDIAHKVFQQVMSEAYFSPGQEVIDAGVRLVHALGAAKASEFKTRIKALSTLLEREPNSSAKDLAMACVRSLVSMPKDELDRPFWERLVKISQTKALASRALRDIDALPMSDAESMPMAVYLPSEPFVSRGLLGDASHSALTEASYASLSRAAYAIPKGKILVYDTTFSVIDKVARATPSSEARSIVYRGEREHSENLQILNLHGVGRRGKYLFGGKSSGAREGKKRPFTMFGVSRLTEPLN